MKSQIFKLLINAENDVRANQPLSDLLEVAGFLMVASHFRNHLYSLCTIWPIRLVRADLFVIPPFSSGDPCFSIEINKLYHWLESERQKYLKSLNEIKE